MDCAIPDVKQFLKEEENQRLGLAFQLIHKTTYADFVQGRI